MKIGYKLQWSDRAILDLENIIDYLIKKWSDKEVIAQCKKDNDSEQNKRQK